MTRYAAANKAGITQRTIYRAFPSGSTNTTTSPIPEPVSVKLTAEPLFLNAGLKSDYDEKQGNP